MPLDAANLWPYLSVRPRRYSYHQTQMLKQKQWMDAARWPLKLPMSIIAFRSDSDLSGPYGIDQNNYATIR